MWKCPSRSLVFPFFYLGGGGNKQKLLFLYLQFFKNQQEQNYHHPSVELREAQETPPLPGAFISCSWFWGKGETFAAVVYSLCCCK